jgi:hypothetical protein
MYENGETWDASGDSPPAGQRPDQGQEHNRCLSSVATGTPWPGGQGPSGVRFNDDATANLASHTP